jgi:hypothetical protein
VIIEQSSSPLRARAYEHLEATLDESELKLSGSPQKALSTILDALEAGLRGKLTPSYYLASLDPGMGKTLAVCSFLKAWKGLGWEPDSSILIGVSRLDEIKTYVERSGLSKHELGVFTRSDDHNSLGVSQAHHKDARVLFTTHQMILSRARGRLLREVSELQFQGGARTLRLWDETLLPAHPIALRRDTLLGLAESFRPTHPEFLEAVADFVGGLKDEDVGTLIRVPQGVIDRIPRGGWGQLNESDRQRLNSLSLLEGAQLLLTGSGGHGLVLLGSSASLPDDFAPAIVLDASGRVRETYKLWKKYRGNLIRLATAANDYRNLTLRYWPTACGKTHFNDVSHHPAFVEAIAELINQDQDSRWLIVCYIGTMVEFLASVRAAVHVNAIDRVSAINWGKHHATNAYRDIENVVIIGSSTYREIDYPAHIVAASGLPADRIDGIPVSPVRRGEYRHQLLQALCRASVRKASNGIAGKCSAYVIAAPSTQLANDLRKTFPGANIEVWFDKRHILRGRPLAAFEYLRQRFADADTERVAKSEVRVALGLGLHSQLTRVIGDPAFIRCIPDLNIEIGGQSFRRLTCEFDPIDMDDEDG